MESELKDVRLTIFGIGVMKEIDNIKMRDIPKVGELISSPIFAIRFGRLDSCLLKSSRPMLRVNSVTHFYNDDMSAIDYIEIELEYNFK